jgi:signal transduction histidine kinase
VAQGTSLKSEVGASRGRRYMQSSSFVMALFFTILCGGASLSLGYFINYFAKGHFVQSTEAVLDTEIQYLEAVGYENVEAKSDQLYVLLREDGRLPYQIPPSVSLLSEGIIIFDHPENAKRYAAKIHSFDDGRKVLVGFDITEISNDFKFMQWLGIASIGFVMLVVFVAYVISVFVVTGTNKIADTARQIMDTGDLSRRVDVGARWDDLSNMAVVLNMLLDRVQDLMSGVRQVSDNIAHDLRTPLTRMRAHIDALDEGTGKDELLREADQLLNTFNALLRISRIEAEKQKGHFADVDLKALLEDVVAFYEPLAEEKSIVLSADLSEGTLCGDRDLLFQAYANLIDNAVKFTPENGRVHVRLFQDSGRFHVEVVDNGAGVDDADMAKIFDRFYRGEKCRGSSGTGLGLSLVGAVMGLHGGEVWAEDVQPGLKIITVL